MDIAIGIDIAYIDINIHIDLDLDIDLDIDTDTDTKNNKNATEPDIGLRELADVKKACLSYLQAPGKDSIDFPAAAAPRTPRFLSAGC